MLSRLGLLVAPFLAVILIVVALAGVAYIVDVVRFLWWLFREVKK